MIQRVEELRTKLKDVLLRQCEILLRLKSMLNNSGPQHPTPGSRTPGTEQSHLSPVSFAGSERFGVEIAVYRALRTSNAPFAIRFGRFAARLPE
jgi:hypothetical protein